MTRTTKKMLAALVTGATAVALLAAFAPVEVPDWLVILLAFVVGVIWGMMETMGR